MELKAALARLLPAFEAYYTIEPGVAPFAAQAVFHTHGEGYFLIRSAKYAETNSSEFAYFVLEPELTQKRARELAEAAWRAGQQRVCPSFNQRVSDVLLIVLTGRLPSADCLRKIRFARSFRLGLMGYSRLRMAAVEPATGRVACNPLGRELAKLLGRVFVEREYEGRVET